MKGILIFFVAILVAACATIPTPISQAQPVPGERVYVQPTESTANSARVFIVRDDVQMLWGDYGYHQVFLNGKRIATLAKREQLLVNLEPGDYVLGVLFTFGADRTEPYAAGWSVYSLDQTLQSGRTYYYRVLIDGNGASRIQRFLPDDK